MNDYEDLARVMLGLPEDADVDKALMDKYEIDISTFEALVEDLIPFTPSVYFSNDAKGEIVRWRGFEHHGALLVRQKVDK